MKFSRRSFMKMGAVVSVGNALAPTFLTRIAEAADKSAVLPHALAGGSKAVIIIQMSGGNDGLNTVVPYTDSKYYAQRKDIAIPASSVFKLNGTNVGLHPKMTEMKAFYDAGKLAIVQGVGYPNPDYSHFRAMEIWHTAAPDKMGYGVGWLGRYLDSLPSTVRRKATAHAAAVMADEARRAPLERRYRPSNGGDLAFNRTADRTVYPSTGRATPQACTNLSDVRGGGISLTSDIPAALWAQTTVVPSIYNFADYRFISDDEAATDEGRARLLSATNIYNTAMGLGSDSLSRYVAANALDALQTSKDLATAYPGETGDKIENNAHFAPLKGSYLAYQLFHVSELLKADLDYRVFYVNSGGYDTHDRQPGDQADLLAELSKCLKALWDDLSECGLDKHVAVMTFSEFGRRVSQNASNGTDHGSALPMFILADSANLTGNRLVGRTLDLTADVYPDDQDDSGNLIPQIDFRSVYAAVMRDWMGVSDNGLLSSIIQHDPNPATFYAQRSGLPRVEMGLTAPIFNV